MVGFSDLPPTAYAYELEEQAIAKAQWEQGTEISEEEYHRICEE